MDMSLLEEVINKPQITYTIIPPSNIIGIVCFRCGYTSYHPKDVEELWCNICDKSHVRYKNG